MAELTEIRVREMLKEEEARVREIVKEELAASKLRRKGPPSLLPRRSKKSNAQKEGIK